MYDNQLGSVKSLPVRVFGNRTSNGRSDKAVFCGDATAVNIACIVGGSGSATVAVLGASEEGGNYVQLSGDNVVMDRVSEDSSWDVLVGTAWVRIEISNVSGTPNFTIVVTPWRSPAQPKPRPQYYDRNATPQHKSYQASVAPHAGVQRWIYTVPTGRSAFVETIYMQIRRTSAPGTAALSAIAVNYTPNGGTKAPITGVTQSSAVLDQTNPGTMTSFGLMSAGDAMNAETVDGSVGGTNEFTVTAKFTEFDQ